MKRLFGASVTRPGKTEHLVIEGGVRRQIGHPVSVLVVEVDKGFYLFRNDEHGVCLADTWHVTLEEAKEQADFEYGIEEADWFPAEEHVTGQGG
jgi:hypothetical protein